MNIHKLSKQDSCLIVQINSSTNKSSLIKLRENYPKLLTQFINPGSILNLQHLIFAIKQSYYAKKHNLLAAREFEVDLLMRISITDQIEEALKIAGISPKNKFYLIASVGKIKELTQIHNWIVKNLEYSTDININNYRKINKLHNIDLDKLNQSNIELDLLSYSAVKLVSRFSD